MVTLLATCSGHRIKYIAGATCTVSILIAYMFIKCYASENVVSSTERGGGDTGYPAHRTIARQGLHVVRVFNSRLDSFLGCCCCWTEQRDTLEVDKDSERRVNVNWQDVSESCRVLVKMGAQGYSYYYYYFQGSSSSAAPVGRRIAKASFLHSTSRQFSQSVIRSALRDNDRVVAQSTEMIRR